MVNTTYPQIAENTSTIDYRLLINPFHSSQSTSIAESTAKYNCLTERHLQAMWLEQKYFHPLSTTDHLPIRVISPGVWNGEAGPDFLKAHIKVGELDLRGDIEIHLFDEGWYQHRHHTDGRYDNVILHVGFWVPKQIKPICTSQNRSIYGTHLQPSLTIAESRIVKLIDLDLYPYKHFVGSGRCSRTLFSSLSEKRTSQLLKSAASWRLTQKWQHLLEKFESPHDAIKGGIAMALGYKHNTEQFADLFTKIKGGYFESEHQTLSHLLAFTGFFEDDYQQRWAASQIYQSLLEKAEGATKQISLRCDRVRPANHPIRRLAVLAKLHHDNELQSLHSTLLSVWQKYWNNEQLQDRKRWKCLRDSLVAALPTYSDTYWEHHYTFEERAKEASTSLLGSDLKKEIIVNVFLPAIYEYVEGGGNPTEIEAFHAFYSTISASDSRKGKYLEHRFFGETKKRELLKNGDTQQGAYQIHKDFCIHHEASCVGCPFVDRFVSAFGRYTERVSKVGCGLCQSPGVE